MKKIFSGLLIWLFLPGFILAQEYKIKPGVIITKENYGKYLPELKELLPAGTFSVFINGVKNGWITIPVVKRRKYQVPPGWGNFTSKNSGKFKVAKDNKLIGEWKSGLPFPYPETGAELAMNIYRRREVGEEFKTWVRWYLKKKTGPQKEVLRTISIKKVMWAEEIFPLYLKYLEIMEL
ncbi:MAG: DUF1329 domain-containing protein [Thermodesulfobacteriota bacterium]|nr:DUF1329 domain-containing protein [Thermodesulfobacteriota bacterium]